MDCVFLEPLNFEGTSPTDGQPFAYSKVVCQSAEQPVPDKDFFITKSITYGEVCTYALILILVVAFTIKIAWNLVHQNPAEKL